MGSKMIKGTKTKVCRFCGRELTGKDPIRGKQCTECSMKRMARWWELQTEAKRKFDKEWG